MANNSAFPKLPPLTGPDGAIGSLSGSAPFDLAHALIGSRQFDLGKDAVGSKLAALARQARTAPKPSPAEAAATLKAAAQATGAAAGSLAKFLKTDRGRATAALLSGIAVGTAVAIALARTDPHIRPITKFGPAAVYTRRTEDGSRLRVMAVDDVYQSATYLGQRWNELPFEYLRAFDRMFDAGLPIHDTLMLGGGGFAYPKHLLTTHPEVSMDVVEPDVRVIRMAMDYFYLDRLVETCPDRLGIYQNNGLSYLQTAERSYDAILNDAFRGAQPARNLATVEAANLVKAHLNPGGLYLVNTVAHSSTGDYSQVADTTAVLESAFSHVWVIESTDKEFSEEDNYLVIASDGDYGFSDAIPY